MTQAVIQTTVTGMQGRPIATTAPAANQAYTWSGTAWAPTGPFLPLAGGILTGPLRLQYPGATGLIVNDTSTSITAGGLWRGVAQSGTFYIQSNTATAGDFSTAAVAFQATSTGAVTVGNGLTVNGNITASGNINPSGTITAGGSLVAGGIVQAAGGAVSVGTSGDFFLQDQPTTGSRILQWGIGWFDSWSSANGLRQWTNQNGAIMFLDGSGNLTISGVLAQGSDQTNKTNINPLAAGISLVRQLLPKSFAWNTAPNVIHWGFIAQDIESVIPEAVSQMELGASGGTPTLSLDSMAILAAVTMAVKQIDQRLTVVEAHDGITPPAGTLA